MIDIDALFEKFFRKFIAENIGKYSEDELESKVGEVYDDFGNAPLKELGDISPREFFKNMNDKELVLTLKNCVESGTAVSDFLCDELSRRTGVYDGLLELIAAGDDDELSTYCVNVLRFNSRVKEAFPTMLKALIDEDCGDSLAEVITEVLGDAADLVKNDILNIYYEYPKAQKFLIELLSKCSIDSRVTELLINEFRTHNKEYYIYAGYLGKYGDSEALGCLYDALKGEKLSYLDYKEIKLAIEELGGEIENEVDYSSDLLYKKLH